MVERPIQVANVANTTNRIGQLGYIVGFMTKEDEAFADAIVDQINAELGASGVTMKDLAKMLGRPYDSTRNYLKKERTLPFGIFLEMARVLNIAPEEVITRARGRLSK